MRLLLLPALLACGLASAAPPLAPGYVAGSNYAERAAAAVRLYAGQTPRAPDFPKDAMPVYAARMQLGAEVPATLTALDRMMNATLRSRLDPFHLHAILHGYCVARDRYPAALRAKFAAYAARWDYTKPIGVSLNYELMRDGGGWMAAQEFPNLRDAAGHNAAQIQALCSARLLRTLAATTARNASEYESPLYYGTDMMALRMLAEFAQDPRLQRAAHLTLAWMLVQTGAHWHRGYYITTSGRAKYWGSNNLGPDNPGATVTMAYLLFGGDRPARLDSVPATYWLAHPGRAVGDWISAWQATLPDRRTVRASLIWPGHGMFVRKQAWMTDGYGLASERTDGSGADSYHHKESRRTMLKWASDRPASSFTVVQENRRRPREKIANAFSYGENPYAQVMQHEGTLIGVYDVPEAYGFWKLRIPFTRRGAIVARKERDGWVFCHGGRVLFAFRSLAPASWGRPDLREGLDLYECEARCNGWILQTAPVARFAGGGAAAELDRFAAALLATNRIGGAATSSPPRLVYRDLAGHSLDLRWHPPEEPYGGQCVLDGRAVDYGGYPLLATTNVHQDLGGPMRVDLGSRRIVLDFSNQVARVESATDSARVR